MPVHLHHPIKITLNQSYWWKQIAGSQSWAVFKPIINAKCRKSSYKSLIATLRDMVHDRRTQRPGKIVDVIKITNVVSVAIIEGNPGGIM